MKKNCMIELTKTEMLETNGGSGLFLLFCIISGIMATGSCGLGIYNGKKDQDLAYEE